MNCRYPLDYHVCPFSAAVTNFSCIIALMFWRPHPNQLAVFFVFPALWGMADAIWQTQTNGKKLPMPSSKELDIVMIMIVVFIHRPCNNPHIVQYLQQWRGIYTRLLWNLAWICVVQPKHCFFKSKSLFNHIFQTVIAVGVCKHLNLTYVGPSSVFCPAALYGVLFPQEKEAAFANYRMWESLGFVIAFAYSTFLCLEYKLYILLAVLLVTVITYPIVEYREYKNPTPPIEERTYLSHKETAQTEDKTVCQTKM